MNRTKVDYSDLNARAQENYLYAKLSAQLADYGYTCLRLSDDYNGADQRSSVRTVVVFIDKPVVAFIWVSSSTSSLKVQSPV